MYIVDTKMFKSETIQVGIGVSQQKDAGNAVKEAMQQARQNLTEEISAAFVFSSTDFAHPTAIKAISNLLGNQAVLLGASAAAVLCPRGIFKNALGIMLLSLPQTIHQYSASVKEIHKKNAGPAGDSLGTKLLSGFTGSHRDLGIILSDGMIEEGSVFIQGIQEKLGLSFPLIGGSASDNLSFNKTYTYFNQEITNDSACGIMLGGKLNFGWGTKHGWKPLGKPRIITSAHANVVYEIDNEPAIKIYQDYLAADINKLKKELRRISIFYPIGIQLAGEKEYLLRNVHSIAEQGALIFQGNVPTGSSIRLMIGTKETCLEATDQALEEAKARMAGKKIKFALIFDSVSRYLLLGRNAKDELAIIKRSLGEDTPFFGFYTFGEQAPLGASGYFGRTHFHNQTITVLGIGE